MCINDALGNEGSSSLKSERAREGFRGHYSINKNTQPIPLDGAHLAKGFVHKDLNLSTIINCVKKSLCTRVRMMRRRLLLWKQKPSAHRERLGPVSRVRYHNDTIVTTNGVRIGASRDNELTSDCYKSTTRTSRLANPPLGLWISDYDTSRADSGRLPWNNLLYKGNLPVRELYPSKGEVNVSSTLG